MKRKVFVATVAFVFSISLCASGADDFCRTQVATAEGPVTGRAVEGISVCAYKGVPYAAPPVGQLRWRAPEPPLIRAGVFEAKRFGNICMQKGSGAEFMAPGEKGRSRKEDCLNLNVWRPQKSGTFPVMVWIHGGGLTTGAGSFGIYWGERLAASRDVVVVTINYRLGALGFLALPELAAETPGKGTGNYGLLDQIAALAWVRDNIAGFGGDPQNVTIFGESAGGWSVCYLLASPLASGLFHKAIIESGGCDAVIEEDVGYSDGRAYVHKLGCSAAADVPSCLRAIKARRALKTVKRKPGRPAPLDALDEMTWLGHIDGVALARPPIESLTSGNFNRVPLLVGTNRDELKIIALAAPGIRYLPRDPVSWILRANLPRDISRGIEKYYPYPDYKWPLDAALDAAGDIGLGCKCFDAAEAASAHRPVYYYRFDYDAHLLPGNIGAMHAIEIPFVFDTLDKAPAFWLFTYGQRQRADELVDYVMSYWTNFARTGDPNAAGLLQWPAYDTGARSRMILDLPPRVEPARVVDKCRYWRDHQVWP